MFLATVVTATAVALAELQSMGIPTQPARYAEAQLAAARAGRSVPSWHRDVQAWRIGPCAGPSAIYVLAEVAGWRTPEDDWDTARELTLWRSEGRGSGEVWTIAWRAPLSFHGQEDDSFDYARLTVANLDADPDLEVAVAYWHGGTAGGAAMDIFDPRGDDRERLALPEAGGYHLRDVDADGALEVVRYEALDGDSCCNADRPYATTVLALRAGAIGESGPREEHRPCGHPRADDPRAGR